MQIIKKENLKLILIITFIIHVAASVYSVGFHHVDEHYQIFEFADLKLGVNKPSELPWEYGNRIRPAIQPAIAYLIIKASDFVGVTNPFDQAMITRILSSALSILCLYLLFAAFRDQLNSEKLTAWFIYLSFFLWFLIYLGVRFSSEGWSHRSAGCRVRAGWQVHRCRLSRGHGRGVGCGHGQGARDPQGT